MDNEQTTEAVTETETPAVEQHAQPSVDDLMARISELEGDRDKWKALSRKNEHAAKSKEAPRQEAPQTDDPVAALRAELLREKATDKLEVAAERAGLDISDVLEFVSVDKFITNGSVDTEAIAGFVGKFAPKKPAFKQGIGVGPQGGGSTQLTKSDLKKMSPEAIVKAQNEGRLDNLLGRNK